MPYFTVDPSRCCWVLDVYDLESIQLGDNALQFDNNYEQSLLIMNGSFFQLQSLDRLA